MSDRKKERNTFTLDPAQNRYLQQSSVNASGLVNQLVKQHRESQTKADAVLRYREEQLESEIREIEARLHAKERELAELQERREAIQAEQASVDDQMDGLLDRMESDGIHIAPDHEDVMALAQASDREPAAVIDALKDRAIEQERSITSGQFMWAHEAEQRGIDNVDVGEAETDE